MLRTLTVLLTITIAGTAQAGDFKLTSRTQRATCTLPDDSKEATAPICTVEELPESARDRKRRLYEAERFLLSGAKFSFEGGRTNEAGFTEDGVSLPVRFDNATNTRKLTVG